MKRVIQVFEHSELKVGNKASDGSVFTINELNTLSRWKAKKEAEDKVPVTFFEVRSNCLKFRSYTGVIVVGSLQIEVLPKIDQTEERETVWQHLLVEMLLFTESVQPKLGDEGELAVFQGGILELYFTLFLNELEKSYQFGLLQKYNTVNAVSSTIRGKWEIGKQLKKGTFSHHQFYVSYGSFTLEHLLNRVLADTLKLIVKLPLSSEIKNKSRQLLSHFPDLKPVKCTDSVFKNLLADRQNRRFEKSIHYARLILLNYYPDVMSGHNSVFALMFNMNTLWERFLIQALQKTKQVKKVYKPVHPVPYWKLGNINRSHTPDLLIEEDEHLTVADAKWKTSKVPEHNDLRQLYTYMNYYKTGVSCLIFPGLENKFEIGYFITPLIGVCCIMHISPLKNGRLNRTIGKDILAMISSVHADRNQQIG